MSAGPRGAVDGSVGGPPAPGAGANCGHCGAEAAGYASALGARLCHPDEGRDCYRLVTVYGHPLGCDGCAALARYGYALPLRKALPSFDRVPGAL